MLGSSVTCCFGDAVDCSGSLGTLWARMYVCRAVLLAVELTGGRVAVSGRRCSHLISPGCHHTSWAWNTASWEVLCEGLLHGSPVQRAIHVLAPRFKAFHKELCEVVMVKCCYWVCSVLQPLHRGYLITWGFWGALCPLSTSQTLIHLLWMIWTQQGRCIPFKLHLCGLREPFLGLAPAASHFPLCRC